MSRADVTHASTPHDIAGHIEVRGIDFIPDAERHGRPGELFWLWFAANITYLYFVLGGALILFGLTLWQAFAVVVIGNLFWLGVGYLAITGPAAGTAGAVVTRAMYGIRANRYLGASLSWLIAVAYESVNLALGSLAGFALAGHLGFNVGTPAKVIIFALIAAITFTISVYGHATMVRLSPIFTLLLAAALALLGVFVLAQTDWGYQPAEPPVGLDLTVVILIGISIIASSPLSWQNGADYSRYLPATVSRFKVMAWTAAGGLVPAVLIAALGVLAGTAIDMEDPQTSIAEIVPGWFYPLFLALVVLGSITNNILTAYSSGLCLQAMGVRASRAWTVVIDAVIAGAIAIYALSADQFLDRLTSILEMTVAFLSPMLAIYVIDIFMRRNRYDGVQLNDESPGSKYWYRGGVQFGGVVALVLGTMASAMCLSTSEFQGPIARALNGADISLIVGIVVGGVIYLAWWAVDNPRTLSTGGGPSATQSRGDQSIRRRSG